MGGIIDNQDTSKRTIWQYMIITPILSSLRVLSFSFHYDLD